MKSQLRHAERQLIHSHELAVARHKREYIKSCRKWRRVGWGLMGIWLLFTVGCVILGKDETKHRTEGAKKVWVKSYS